ncbi:MAG: DUF3054 domain-containing protein [Burkholderiaceae bacterium]|nr:DUF3054 domain-containing protein [Microbacteriaceae bacterium]
MATKRARAALATGYFLIDVTVVLLFIYAGRETRGVSLIEDLAQGGPFVAGIIVGWLGGRVWRAPRRVMWQGIAVWVSTVVIGLALRVASGDPTDSRFMFITFISLGAFLLGWRGVAWILDALFGRARPRVVDDKYRK